MLSVATVWLEYLQETKEYEGPFCEKCLDTFLAENPEFYPITLMEDTNVYCVECLARG